MALEDDAGAGVERRDRENLQPEEWKSGTTTSTRSRLERSKKRSALSELNSVLRCGRRAPLGVPVVPEVYIRIMGSSGETGATAKWGSLAASADS